MQRNTDIFERLHNHCLPIDESFWAEMEERLQKKRKKRVSPWIWFTGTGMAASLALIFTVRIFNANDVTMQIAQVEQISPDKTVYQQYENEHKSTLSEYEKNEQDISTQITQIKQIFTDKTTLQQHQNLQKPVQSASSAYKKNEATANDQLVPTNPDTIPEKPDESELKYYEWLLAANDLELKKEKIQDKNSWEIAAAVSSSASNYSSNNDFAFLADNINGSELTSGFDRSPSKDELIDDIHGQFPEITHLPPLSVGLTVRKNLNKHLAIETGLTYSFLQSKFKEESKWLHRDAALKLHYLGIPVNAIVYLLNKPKWNVYFSLGGMVEKGIMQDYTQHSTYKQPYLTEDESVYKISLQDDIPGLQWSLNTSFGIGYKIYHDISIYFEPRIIYYLKNNQPVSARTEAPFSVGLNAGLRFEF